MADINVDEVLKKLTIAEKCDLLAGKFVYATGRENRSRGQDKLTVRIRSLPARKVG